MEVRQKAAAEAGKGAQVEVARKYLMEALAAEAARGNLEWMAETKDCPTEMEAEREERTAAVVGRREAA